MIIKEKINMELIKGAPVSAKIKEEVGAMLEK